MGFESCDVVPTEWVTLEIGDGEIVGVWYPNCHVSQPSKCLQLVKSAKPPNKAESKLYEVKLLYLTDSYMKADAKAGEALYKSDINTDCNAMTTMKNRQERDDACEFTLF